MTETLGFLLVNSCLPKGYSFKPGVPVDSKELNKVLLDIAKNHPDAYVETVTKLKRLGDSIATDSGISVGLDDIAPAHNKDHALAPFIHKFNNAETAADKRKILGDAQEKMLEVTKNHPGDMALMSRSGGRGSFAQLMKITSAPVLATDAKGQPIPWLISHSYSEGITPAESFAALNESRQNAIQGKLAVSLPGELNKLITQSVNNQVVSSVDCGTTNGNVYDPHDPWLVDRYLAHPVGKFKAGTLITHGVAQQLKKLGKPVVARSPLTCQSQTICQKCYGLDERAQPPTIGTNLGVQSAQAITEPIVQSQLSSKHSIKTLSSKNTPQGVKGIRQLLEVPESFTGAAVLAKVHGKVTGIEKAPQGGSYVFVESEQHYVPPDRDVTIKKHDVVEHGDPLSSGILKPDEIVKYRGIGVGRKNLADNLIEAYKNNGINIDPRHLELIARGAVQFGVVQHDPHGDYLPGDTIDITTLRERLKDGARSTALKEAEGKVLADDHLHFSAGTTITPSMIKTLSHSGVEHVKVAVNPPKVEFLMKPAAYTPLLFNDWLGKLSHRFLRQTIVEGAEEGQSSPTHSYNPGGPLARGVDFGTGEDGQY
jgi:hypothetical protein